MAYVSGSVVDDTGTAAGGMTVRCYRRDTGALIGSTTSASAFIAGDSSFSNVKLLTHLDGANGSTTFTEETGKTFTTSGSPTISTAQSKFGGASLLLGGSDMISTPNVSDFNMSSSSTDFTIEAWIYPTSISANRGVIGSRTNGAAHGWCVYVNSSGYPYMGCLVSGYGWANQAMHTSTIPLNTWTHIALVKTSSGYTMYVNGVGGTLFAQTGGIDYQSTQDVVIGALASQGEFPFVGYIDEVRVTVGLARYTSNFTPSAAAFPSSGSDVNVGDYRITTSYTSEVNVVCLDDAAGTVYNDKIVRTTPV